MEENKKAGIFMCLIAIAFQVAADYPLVIAANRDEFYSRPTKPSHWWKDAPILAGRDLEKSGTWMGISKSGRVCALTNYRDLSKQAESKESRGHIVRSFLESEQSPEAFLKKLDREKHRYPGFNLIAGTESQLFAYESESEAGPFPLEPGIHAVSNAFFNTPWPKTLKVKSQMASLMHSEKKLFQMLSDFEQAPDDYLPATGLPIEWERRLSPVFIQSPDYGTRSSTILRIRSNKTVEWFEKTFGANGPEQEKTYFFSIV